MRYTRVVVVLVALLWQALPALGQPSPAVVDTEAAAIFDQVMSPYCPGRTLATCGSSAAEDLRDDVRGQLAAGQSPQDVEEGLYRRFGESIRAVPRASGTGLLAWVLPMTFLAGGGLWLMTWLRLKTRGKRHGEEVEATPASPDLIDRLEDELASL